MPSFYLQKNSPYYWISYYDKEKPPGKRRTGINTKIQVTQADLDKYKAWKAADSPRGKLNLQGNKEVRDRLKKFNIALAERDMYAKAGFEVRITKNLKEGLADYLYNHPKITKATIDSYKYAFKLFIEVIGNKEIHHCTAEDCSKFIRHLILKPYSEATQNSYTKRIWVLFNYFVKKKWINENIITVTAIPEYFPEPIPENDLGRIINFFKNKRTFRMMSLKMPYKSVQQKTIDMQLLLIRLMLETGFRQSTILKLTPDAIELAEKRIKAINVKRNNKPFYFPIHKRLKEIIKPLLKTLPFPYKSYDTLSFWQRDIKKLYDKGMISRKYQMYQLRDTFNSRLANAGVDESTRDELMNHYSGSINRTHYTQYQGKYLIAMIDKALAGKV